MNFEVQLLLNNALSHIQLKEFDKAHALLSKAMIISPREPDVLRLMSVNLALQLRFNDALVLINDLIDITPNNGLAHSNRGNILKELGNYEEALIALNKAIDFSPHYAEAYSNKGNILQSLHRYEEALDCYDKAIELNPSYAEAYANKGNAYQNLGLYEEALSWFHKSTEINPNYIDGYWLKAMNQLPRGDFLAGWQNYEARWFKADHVVMQFTDLIRLESLSDIEGKKILVWSEQGLGDCIQFSRYIKLLSERGAQVTFLTEEVLLRTFASLRDFCELRTFIEDRSKFDFQSPLLSLPLLFETTLDSIPANIPYLSSDPEKRKEYSSQIKHDKNLNVGLIWNGGNKISWAVNGRRNIELEVIANLRGVTGVNFYSLQKGDPAQAELTLKKDYVWPEIIDCSPLLNDFSDTAALMDQMDLIISVDTSSAHLAGALGKPVWILNRYDSCWRWLRGREDSPWYPTAKIYQQKKPGDWSEVITRVRLDLANLAQKSAPASKC